MTRFIAPTASVLVALLACSSSFHPAPSVPGTWRTPANWPHRTPRDNILEASVSLDDWSTAVIRLRRDGCYGPCPMYDVSVYPDGLVEYEGRDHVPLCGRHTTHIDRKNRDRLASAFRLAEFLSRDFPGSSYGFDGETVYLSVTVSQFARSVMHDDSDSNAPVLTTLEGLVDATAGIQEWTSCSDRPCHCSTRRPAG